MSAYKRVRQFVRAVTQRMTSEDYDFVRHHLPENALPLFFAMHPADQVHVRNVAFTALKMAEERGLAAEQKEFLLRCALLHDVGRVKGDLNIMGKVMAVLMTHYLPKLSAAWQKKQDPIGHALYVYRHHPAIGAEKLKAIGLMQEAAVIAHHHERERAGDSEVLKILRAADEQN